MQAKLRAKLDKEEKAQADKSKNDDVQGVEVHIGQDAVAKPSGGCCSML